MSQARWVGQRPLISVAGALAALVIGLAPIPRRLAGQLTDALPRWQHLGLLRLGIMVAGLGLTAYYWQAWRRRPSVSGPAHALLALSVVSNVALVLMLLVKYAIGLIPETWAGDLVFLYATAKPSLIDLYSRIDALTPPIVTPIYPPGYYLALHPLLRLFGGGPEVARGLSLLGIATVAIALAYAARGQGARGRPALAALLFLAVFPQLTWSGVLTKPEYVAAALTTLGFAFYLRPGFDNEAWDWAIGFCFGLGLIVKYTIVGTLIGTVAHLVLRRRPMRVVRVGVASLLPFAGLYGLLWVPTQGGVWLFTVAGNAARPDLLNALTYGVLEFLPRAFSVLMLSGVAWLYVRDRTLHSRQGAVGAAVVCATMVFVAATGRPGSSANYFLEVTILGSLLLAYIAGDVADAVTGGVHLWRVLLSVLLLVQLPAQAALVAQSYGNHAQQREQTLAILRKLEVAPDQFVLGDAYYTKALVESGKRPLVYDNHAFSLMHDNGVVPAEPLLSPIRDGRVPFVILENTVDSYRSQRYGGRHFPPPVTERIAADYTCDELLEQWDGAKLILCRNRPPR